MKRFNLPSMNIPSINSSSQQSSNISPPTVSNATTPANSSQTDKSSILSAMSLGSLPNMNILKSANSMTENATKMTSMRSLFSHGDETSSNAQKNRLQNQNINLILKILEDIKLQRPSHHTGLVVAYSSALLAPIVYKGIKFTWYRLGDDNQFTTVDDSSRSWYAPTVDDIGCKICVQCEDNYQEGFSRYVECEPLLPDPLLLSLLESSLKNSFYEALDVSVSLGLDEKEIASNYDETISNHSTDVVESSPITTIQDQVTSLVSGPSFLQFNGHSAIKIDSKGLFISIPVTNTEAANSANHNSKASKPTFRTSSRGLRISPSESIRVHCSQPAAIVIEIPIRTSQTSKSTSEITSGSSEIDHSMQSFLTSATLTIPWVYEGVHSPEVVAKSIDNHDHTSEEEKERRKREAEEDSINFANMVVSLAEFIASIPDSAREIKICISCNDRLQRDMLACTIRAIICQPPGTTTAERLSMFPWLQRRLTDEAFEEGEGPNETSAYDVQALKQRLRSLEEENFSLKRERNELLEQIMDEREAAIQRENMMSNSSRNLRDSSSSNDLTLSTTTDDLDRKKIHASTEDMTIIDGEKGEESPKMQRNLAAKVIELENKLQIASKKEMEEMKFREELETRNAQIAAENEKCQRLMQDHSIELTLLRHERDQHEIKANTLREKLQEQDKRFTEMELEMKQVNERMRMKQKGTDDVNELQQTILEKSDECVRLSNTLSTVQQEIESIKSIHRKDMEILQTKLQEATDEMNRWKREHDQLLQEKAEWNQQLEEQLRLTNLVNSQKIALIEAETRVNQLQSEANHLISKADSQAKDLKKTLKENAVVISEYEKALVSKCDECIELHSLVLLYEGQLKELSSGANSSTTNFLNLGFNLPNPPTINMDPIRNILDPVLSSSGVMNDEDLNSNTHGSSNRSNRSVSTSRSQKDNSEKRERSYSNNFVSMDQINKEYVSSTSTSSKDGAGLSVTERAFTPSKFTASVRNASSSSSQRGSPRVSPRATPRSSVENFHDMSKLSQAGRSTASAAHRQVDYTSKVNEAGAANDTGMARLAEAFDTHDMYPYKSSLDNGLK